MKVTVRVDGLKELDEALGALSKATARSVLYRVLNRAAAPMDAAWRGLAPRDTGLLARSGGVVKTTAAVGDAAYASALRGGATKGEAVQSKRDALRATAGERAFAEVAVGPGRNPQAVQQEFGNVNHPPQPFMRPAWEATKGQALQIIAEDLGQEIRKTAAQVAKRAAAKAAKG